MTVAARAQQYRKRVGNPEEFKDRTARIGAGDGLSEARVSRDLEEFALFAVAVLARE